MRKINKVKHIQQRLCANRAIFLISSHDNPLSASGDAYGSVYIPLCSYEVGEAKDKWQERNYPEKGVEILVQRGAPCHG